MTKISLNRLGGLCLISGPLLALIFFLIQPGGLLIDRADSLDSVESINALASNTVLTHITALVIPLGLALGLFGLYAAQRKGRDNEGTDALSRLGFFFLAIGMAGWIMSQGLNHVVADEESLDVALPIFLVGWGITLMAGLCVALGFLAFSLGLSNRSDVNKVIALVVALASAVALVSLVIGGIAPAHSQLSNMITISRIGYFVWVAWTIVLGVGLVRSSGADARSAA